MFDPIAYIRDVRAHPENYIAVSQVVKDATDLHAIRKARTLEALKKAFQVPAKAAKDAGDTELLAMLTEAKDKRKAELTEAL